MAARDGHKDGLSYSDAGEPGIIISGTTSGNRWMVAQSTPPEQMDIYVWMTGENEGSDSTNSLRPLRSQNTLSLPYIEDKSIPYWSSSATVDGPHYTWRKIHSSPHAKHLSMTCGDTPGYKSKTWRPCGFSRLKRMPHTNIAAHISTTGAKGDGGLLEYPLHSSIATTQVQTGNPPTGSERARKTDIMQVAEAAGLYFIAD
ncbi:hypothetical protein EDD16DRAFT_1520925 [Pisolithus croceorrhizus]|nr:hypothetical protein EDD16DRAFT_1520925 [Pisolithus croceorrhizus]